jgi:hypothetical protein
LPFAKVSTARELSKLALIFGVKVEDYATITQLSQHQHIGIGRSLKTFGFEYSQAWLAATGGGSLYANKGMTLEVLRAQLCRIFGITIPQQESVAKLSRKARFTKSTPKKRSAKTKYKNSTPNKALKKILMDSPSIKSLLYSASSSNRHAADPMRRTVTKTKTTTASPPTRTASPPPHPLDADVHFRHALKILDTTFTNPL